MVSLFREALCFGGTKVFSLNPRRSNWMLLRKQHHQFLKRCRKPLKTALGMHQNKSKEVEVRQNSTIDNEGTVDRVAKLGWLYTELQVAKCKHTSEQIDTLIYNVSLVNKRKLYFLQGNTFF